MSDDLFNEFGEKDFEDIPKYKPGELHPLDYEPSTEGLLNEEFRRFKERGGRTMSNDPFKEIGEFEFDFMPDYQANEAKHRLQPLSGKAAREARKKLYSYDPERSRNIKINEYIGRAQAADITVEAHSRYDMRGPASIKLAGEDGIVVIADFDAIGNLERETVISEAGIAVW